VDDCSRYVIAWKLRKTMKAKDVAETLELALAASGFGHAEARPPLLLLSDQRQCSSPGGPTQADVAIAHTRIH
jgi:transposase InsO family protein